MTSAPSHDHHAADIGRIRSLISWVMLAWTAVLAVLWLVLGASAGAGLLLATPAAAIFALVWVMCRPRSPFFSSIGRGAGLLVLLAVFGGAGSYFVERVVEDIPSSSLLTLWQWLHQLWWPMLVVGMIMRYVLFRMLPRAARTDEIARNRAREIDYERRISAEMNSLSAPSGPGRITGFEPDALAAVTIGEHEQLYGAPGAGLTGSGFAADAVAKGQLGELNFARALERSGLLDRFATFWSVHMPDEEVGASRRFETDIDAVVVTGRSIWLLDMKNYTQGAATWVIEDGSLRLIDDATGGYIGAPRSMSRNMELAQSRLAEKFHGLGVRQNVRSRVVFMPTDMGMGTIRGVVWPGGIPAVGIEGVLAELSAEPPFDPNARGSEDVLRVLRWLVKDETGSAPRLGEAWKHAPGRQRSQQTRAQQTQAQQTQATQAPAQHAPHTQQAAAPQPQHPANTQPAPQPSAAATAQPSGSSAAARTCSECGTAFGGDWTFCWNCGAQPPTVSTGGSGA